MPKKKHYKEPVSVSIDDQLLKVSKELGINRSEFAQMGMIEAVKMKIETLNESEKARYTEMIKHLE